MFLPPPPLELDEMEMVILGVFLQGKEPPPLWSLMKGGGEIMSVCIYCARETLPLPPSLMKEGGGKNDYGQARNLFGFLKLHSHFLI